MSILLNLCSWVLYRICVGKVKLYSLLQSLGLVLAVYQRSIKSHNPKLIGDVRLIPLKQKHKLYRKATSLNKLHPKLALSNISLWKTAAWVLVLRFSVFFKLLKLTRLVPFNLSCGFNFLTSVRRKAFCNLPLDSFYLTPSVNSMSFLYHNTAKANLVNFAFKSGHKQAGLRFFLINEENKLRGILASTLSESSSKHQEATTCSLVLTEVPATSLAAMFGYSRRYQKTPFIRFSLFKYFRRYFLILEQLALDMTVRGVMRQFKSYFKTVNTPLNQIIKNPVTNAWIADFSLVLKDVKTTQDRAEEISSLVKAALEDSLLSVETAGADVSSKPEEWSHLEKLATDLTNFFLTQLKKAKPASRHRDVILHRYRLTWEHIFFQKIVEHGLKKKKKARSIKKRRTKRLIKKTKYRFWNL